MNGETTKKNSMNALEYFKNIKTFIFDMDGVLTDGKVLVMSGTEWLRTMHIRDGHAIKSATDKGYRIIVISGSTSGPVKKRLQFLGVKDVYMGVSNKKERLEKLIKKYKLEVSEMLYMGDDLPDLECMEFVGLPTCPADAVSELKKVAKYISPFNGGSCCVRDVIEKVLLLNGGWK